MKLLAVVASVAFSSALISGCDRESKPIPNAGAGASRSEVPMATPDRTAPNPVTTPRPQTGNVEKSPVQGQVDPKEPAQRKDFKTGG
ncbi:MAG TPA: hypothetical protein VET51_01745 [Burkholderiales bacterium]|nr:hypothetical protein [Burkholderiales bacterium]